MASRISRAGRKAQIFSQIMEHPHITTYAIAKALGITNSSHFRGIVCEMANDGIIVGRAEVMPNGMTRYHWIDSRLLDGTTQN